MFVFYFEGITGGNNILLLQRRGKNRSRISAHQNFPVVGCCDTIVSSHRKCFMLLDWCVWDCSHVSAVHTAVNKTTVTDTTADVQPFVWKTKLTTGKKHVLTKAISQNIILNINIEFHKWCIVVVVYFFPAWWLFRPLRPPPQRLNTTRQPSYLGHVCKPNMKLALSWNRFLPAPPKLTN